MNYTKHETAIIDDGATVGDNTRIWHWVHVCGGAVIGNNCSLGQNVFVGNRARIGSHVKIQNNVSVYDDVTLEDGVFCGPGMVFTNVMNPRSEIPRKDEYRQTLVRHGATLGANCTILCGITIGEYAFIGAGSVVLRDVPDHALVVGNPAHQIGWMSIHGERLELPLTGNATARCPATGEYYQLQDGICFRQPEEPAT
ncbi:MAG: acyltransferase [Gammaproteobacteria bacterium]|nr:acyltransferase [Gammaproteobacteria bacterium]